MQWLEYHDDRYFKDYPKLKEFDKYYDEAKPKKGEDLEASIEVSLEELRNGKLKEPDVLEKTIKDFSKFFVL